MASSESVSLQAPSGSAEASLSVPFATDLHRRSAESLKNLYDKIRQSQSIQKMKNFAGSTSTMLSQAPSNLKLRIRSVMSQLQSLRVASSDQPSFYLALIRAFNKLYQAPRFTEDLPKFEDFYEEAQNQMSGVFTEAQVESMRHQAYLFFDEVRKQADDSYATVPECLLVSMAVLIDAEFLQGKTRTLLNLVYINTVNQRSEKSSPARREIDEETDASEHNEDNLPPLESVDQIKLEEDTFLEEFTKKFGEEVTWQEIDSKAIAKACYEYHQIAKLSQEEKKESPRRRELSYLQTLQQTLFQLLAGLTDKSLHFYEVGLTLLEKQFPDNEEKELDEEDQALIEKPQKVSHRERLRRLNDRLSKLIKREAKGAYEGSQKALHLKEIQEFLEPYLEAAEPYYKRLVDQGKQVYSFSMKTIVYPVRDNVVLVFNKGALYYSVVVGKIIDTESYKYMQSRFTDARVMFHSQYMRLDFDNDGVVSLEDCKSTANDVISAMRNYEYRERGLDLYERAKQRMKALIAPSE